MADSSVNSYNEKIHPEGIYPIACIDNRRSQDFMRDAIVHMLIARVITQDEAVELLTKVDNWAIRHT